MKFTTNDLNVFIRFAKKIYMSKTTFIMIKPDAVERGLIGNILKDIGLGFGYDMETLSIALNTFSYSNSHLLYGFSISSKF